MASYFLISLLKRKNASCLAFALAVCCISVKAVESASEPIIGSIEPVNALVRRDGHLLQPVRLTFRHATGNASIQIANAEKVTVSLTNDPQTIELLVPAVTEPQEVRIAARVNDQPLPEGRMQLKPVRRLVVYILPHSHTDIGYTEIQTAIEKKQVNNLLAGIEAARRTAAYPEGARFVWNVEVLWAADLYLQRLDAKQREDFFQAVKAGQVGLNGMYLNELTGLCRPRELLELFRYSTELSSKCGVSIDAAMISDVPGYTWGIVTAMAQAGIKYFSVAPNYFDRIGDILVQWENKPFYWVSPSGREKVLVWIPFKGYAMSHIYRQLSEKFVAEYQQELNRKNYPYEIAYMRWSGHGDNAVPDPAICDFVRDWNGKYAYPRFVIATASEAFREFEKRYGDRLPRVQGDWTPYWEDGAGSSASETAMNRATSERLTQAEALWAMLNPKRYPAQKFHDAWRKALLYSEHTWGADISVSDPESRKAKEQWAIKRSYATDADKLSRELLAEALSADAGPRTPERHALSSMGGEGREEAAVRKHDIEVFNTTSWNRDGLVMVAPELSISADSVRDEHGRRVVSQRLNSGELIFAAKAVPAFGSRHYNIGADSASSHKKAVINGAVLDNGIIRVRLDDQTGGIVELRESHGKHNFVDISSGESANEYLFLPGNNLENLKTCGRVKISVKEQGPLVNSLVVESDAPGCKRLVREVRLLVDADYVEIVDTVDKERAAISPKPGDWQFAQSSGKESLNFAFPFNVPGGTMHLDVPLGVMQPEVNQIPGACKNWLSVNRWVDISNDDFGVTWVTLDAPLIEVGEITANLLGSQKNPAAWRKKIARSQKLYSWAMNNHWHTNYRAYQEGRTVFRYAVRVHRKSNTAEATRFATCLSQPLLVANRISDENTRAPLLKLSSKEVAVLALKPADSGKALIVKMFGTGDKDSNVKLSWANSAPHKIWLSDTSERRIKQVGLELQIPPGEVVTLRAEQ
jgi:hypothetical protein